MLARDDGILFCLRGAVYQRSAHRRASPRIAAHRSASSQVQVRRGRIERISFEGQWNSLPLEK
ncbi:hypothetical protein ACMHYB_05670 [Sorangium sp. So ce1128]